MSAGVHVLPSWLSKIIQERAPEFRRAMIERRAGRNAEVRFMRHGIEYVMQFRADPQDKEASR